MEYKNQQQVTCPRCLGKGHVDQADIRRLKKELVWSPGPCAYCNGTGKVNEEQVKRVRVDETYLTTNLSSEEREKLINRDEEATKRAQSYTNRIDRFVLQTRKLYFQHGLTVEQIAGLLLSQNKKLDPSSEEFQLHKNNLIQYIKKIVEEGLPKN
ncbi:MAG: hypothetical protein AAFY71_02905 [Bacteroidota bacterium]